MASVSCTPCISSTYVIAEGVASAGNTSDRFRFSDSTQGKQRWLGTPSKRGKTMSIIVFYVKGGLDG